MTRSYISDPVFRGMVALAALLGAAHFVFWGTARNLAPASYGLLVAMTITGTMVAVTSAAILAIGRHQVLGDRTSYWIGVGFASDTAAGVFRFLNWSGLPKVTAIIGQLPSTRAYVGMFVGTVFAVCLIAAILAPIPAAGTAQPRSKLEMAALPAGVVLVIILVVAFERHLPVLVTETGKFTPLLYVWHGLSAALLFFAAVVATRRYLLSGDTLLAWMAFAALLLGFTSVGLAVGGNRYSLLSAVDRFIGMGADVLLLFGFLADYVRLLKSERKKTREIRRLNATLEQRVRDRTAQLEASNKELEAFSYSVSHDLRTPLRGIDGWTLVLAEDYAAQLDGRAHQYLERVRSEAQRMGILIDDLLQLSRLTRLEMRFDPVDLTSIAQSIAVRLRETHPGRNLDFIIQPGLNAPGDARLLEVALTNLLDNAVKFASSRELARIEFGQTTLDGEHAFFVRDNGVGFDMAYAANLFGAFQRMHKASEFAGNGIGLATVQRIIRRHSGRVWADAQVDRGATFYFTIPEPK